MEGHTKKMLWWETWSRSHSAKLILGKCVHLHLCTLQIHVCVCVHTDVQHIEVHSHRFTEQTIL